ncbi:hypothetical protein [Kitasatospora sp. NPDC058478]|uniref:hypothetical protein n=1 Tax=unclassified Kitasatospora TaxID=2633591 RepID=UPI003655A62D
MTLDAMDWVWKHSQSRGNARIALLAVADRVRTPACEVQVSYSEFMGALNAGRSVVRDAVQAALDSGELELVAAGKGTRSALYRLSKAVGYVRRAVSSSSDYGPLGASNALTSVPDSEPQAPCSGSDSEPQASDQDHASGSESGTEWFEIQTASGSESGTHSPYPAPKRERAIDADGFPDFARPLSDQLTLARVVVRWPFNETEWFKLAAAIKKSGIPALVEYARRTWDRQHGDIDSARYFLNGWCQLPPLPSADAERPPLRAVAGGTPHGWQPYTNPDPSVYKNGWT